MATIYEMLSVMQAYKEGKVIECKNVYRESWIVISGHPKWNWDDFDYRIAPVQPKKTQKVQLYAYLGSNELRHLSVELSQPSIACSGYKRVPSEDKVVEVEE